MLSNNFSRGVIFLLGILFTFNLFANPQTLPANMPDDIQVTAQAFIFDNIKGIAFYQGNVIAKQPHRQLTGDKLEIHRGANSEIDQVVIWGNPAIYQGEAPADNSKLKALAKKITYFPKTEYFILEGNAEISQNNEFYRAPRMEYDANLQKMYSPNSLEGHTSILLKKSAH